MRKGNEVTNSEIIACLHCGSEHLQKHGHRYLRKKGVKIQNFLCSDCKRPVSGIKLYPIEPEPFKYQDQPIPQTNWTAYTEAQNNEKRLLMEILSELLSDVKIEISNGKLGRHYSDMKDICFCLALKTYTKLSSRRLNSDLEKAQQEEFIARVSHFTTIMGWMKMEEMTSLLLHLIKLSALPMKEMETQYSIDSTGFASWQFGRWFDYKFNQVKTCRNWVKGHIMCGTKSHMVVSVELPKAHGADSPQLALLVEKTCKDFNVKEISADRAYLSRKNLHIIVANGALPFIPFKSNSLGKKKGSMVWSKMFEFFHEHPQEYFQHYHRRSNAETVFDMIKQKFGKDVVTRNFQSQTNEVLLKILCHNICCLIAAYYENNIESYYSTDQAQKEAIIKIG